MDIRDSLHHLGVTQRELSELTGVSVSTLNRYSTRNGERGDRLPVPRWLGLLLTTWEMQPASLTLARVMRNLRECARE